MRGLGILLDDSFDIKVKPVRDSTGIIVKGMQVGNTLYQNQAIILVCHAGEISEVPQLGVGIEDMLLDNDYLMWRRTIRMNMERDGQRVNNIQFSKTKQLQIDAGY